MIQAMLETINERHIDLILMGWKVTPSHPVGFWQCCRHPGSAGNLRCRAITEDLTCFNLAGADGGWPQFQSGDSTSTGFVTLGCPIYPSLQGV